MSEQFFVTKYDFPQNLDRKIEKDVWFQLWQIYWDILVQL